MQEFKYKRAPSEIIERNKNILEILRNLKEITLNAAKTKVIINAVIRFNNFGMDAAKIMPMIKKIQIAATFGILV